MHIIHSLGILTLKKEIDDNTGFLLTNKNGSYFSLFSRISSRYHGLFFFDKSAMKMYKFIDSIEVAGSGDITSLKNGFYFAEIVRNSSSEMFFMPGGLNTLVCRLDRNREVDIVLDCRESYDNRAWGRNYEISEEESCIIIKYTKKTDQREDSTDGVEELVLYLAIKSDRDVLRKNESWVERHYYGDELRNSPPFKRHVYNALRLEGSRFVFSMSKSKSTALKECEYAFSNMQQLESREKENFFGMLGISPAKRILSGKNISDEVKVAYISALNSLNNLCVRDKRRAGIIAGFPWFFQFWARDSLASFRALHKMDREFAEKMLFGYLAGIGETGRLSNLFGHHVSSKLGCADAHGWLFLGCNTVTERVLGNKQAISSIKNSISSIRKNSKANPKISEYIKKCRLIILKKEEECHKVLHEIESSLERSIHRLMKSYTSDGFEMCSALETWMDTSFEGDDRKGARIEMQAFRLQMYRLVHSLSSNDRHKALENMLRLKVRQKFWNGEIIADGLNDFTIRPNIFIAAHAYPWLFSSLEWETCIANALKNLWLDWGGLSTIDENSPLFTNESTGEDIKSYHRGDSWFWINNLAALTLNRINNKKFKSQINKIIDASTQEILWKGCVGCHAELSSAKELRSEGCFNQAWSNAMYVEMVDEIFK